MEKENDRKVCARKPELHLSFRDLRVMDKLEQLVGIFWINCSGGAEN